MSISVLVLQERRQADELIRQLKEITNSTIHYQLVKPSDISSTSSKGQKLTPNLEAKESSNEALPIEAVELLNPELSRKKRQSTTQRMGTATTADSPAHLTNHFRRLCKD